MIFILAALVSLFFFAISEYRWRGALLFTVGVGFIQDPVRKLSGIDSSYFAIMALISFIITFLVLRSSLRLWNLKLICWSNPRIVNLIPIFLYIIGIQALNSFARFGDLRLSIIGVLFYTLPFSAFWVGFHMGNEIKLLKTFLIAYISLCSLWGISILLSLYGFQSDLLKEVGEGIQITGIGSGESGLWRTSEIAGWHLAAGACFSFILGMTETKSVQQYLYFFLSVGLGFLTITTGRRKALGLVIVFISLYLLYYSLTVKGNKVSRALSSLFLIILLSASSYGLIFDTRTQANMAPYFDRSATITADESQERFSVQGLGAFMRGIEIGGLFGFGVGTGSNAGTTGIDSARSGVRSLAYVVEGGGGRVIVELGVLGTSFLMYLLVNIGILYFRNFKIGKVYLPNTEFELLVGLVLFAIVNLVTFFSASQLYSDPFVLIVIGLASGTFLSVPILASRYQKG